MVNTNLTLRECKMLNRSEILRAAWANYRETAALIGLVAFSRKHFACALRMAWSKARIAAHVEAQTAEEAAEVVTNPAAAAARSELVALNMKDRWTAADRDIATSLSRALAA